MRILIVLGLLVVAALPAEARRVEGRRLGVGAQIGSPTGGSAEVSLSSWLALDLVIGIDTLGDKDFYGHLDAVAFPLDFAQGGSAIDPLLYLGVGVFALEFHDDAFAGMRFPVGVALDFRAVPVQIYLELALTVLVLTPYDVIDHVDGDLAAGARFFFF